MNLHLFLVQQNSCPSNDVPLKLYAGDFDSVGEKCKSMFHIGFGFDSEAEIFDLDYG